MTLQEKQAQLTVLRLHIESLSKKHDELKLDIIKEMNESMNIKESSNLDV